MQPRRERQRGLLYSQQENSLADPNLAVDIACCPILLSADLGHMPTGLLEERTHCRQHQHQARLPPDFAKLLHLVYDFPNLHDRLGSRG